MALLCSTQSSSCSLITSSSTAYPALNHPTHLLGFTTAPRMSQQMISNAYATSRATMTVRYNQNVVRICGTGGANGC